MGWHLATAGFVLQESFLQMQKRDLKVHASHVLGSKFQLQEPPPAVSPPHV